jgi:hypothetical protein
MSESTCKACRRWWAARGYVAIVRPGRTPDLSPGVLRSPQDRDIRQAYLPCIPRHDHTNAMACANAARNLLSDPAEQALLSVARNEHEGAVRARLPG